MNEILFAVIILIISIGIGLFIELFFDGVIAKGEEKHRRTK